MIHTISSILFLIVAMSCQETGQQQTQLASKSSVNTETSETPMSTLHDFKSQTLDGQSFDFASLKGKRVLIVNTASECGYTPQYEQLQELYATYGGENFTVIGFPSNDFGGQEPGSNEEIASFCQKNTTVIENPRGAMANTPVKGAQQHPVYQWLTHKDRNGKEDVEVQWNFNKFLVNEKGEWVAYYPSSTSPLDEKIVFFAEGK